MELFQRMRKPNKSKTYICGECEKENVYATRLEDVKHCRYCKSDNLWKKEFFERTKRVVLSKGEPIIAEGQL